MGTKSIRKLFLGVVTVLLMMLICTSFAIVTCHAESEVGTVSANCSTKTVKKGDEVRIEVSTKEMTVSTFIANVEYNPQLMTYEGYEGTDGNKSVYLVDAKDKSIHFDVAVEQSEVNPIVGMYAIGTKEKKYSAANPLVTLIFKAKDNGKVEYNVSETADGEDSYTSPGMEQSVESEPVAENHSKFYVVGGIVAALVCLTFVIIRKRKGRKNDD